ncbi:hypothetical protein [Streptomyces sp. NPDC050121]|uniref:hypothetical protein n=1 Tax=Streptomyces sp. NPDC050121 TaxID=3365601 RepID=UPI0037B5B6B2
MNASSQTQITAAIALTQILQEFGDLPPLAWRISNREGLADQLSGGGMFQDPGPVVAAWADALGASVAESPFQLDGQPYIEFAAAVVWRDVRVRICLSCPTSALTDAAVAA